jgi:hypothetical protein
LDCSNEPQAIQILLALARKESRLLGDLTMTGKSGTIRILSTPPEYFERVFQQPASPAWALPAPTRISPATTTEQKQHDKNDH